jgi:DDE family transposase
MTRARLHCSESPAVILGMAVIHSNFEESRDGFITRSVRGSPPRQRGAAFLQALVARKTVCLRRLGDGHGGEVRWGRFLANEKVTVEKLIEGWSDRTVEAVAGRHVLAIQDTTEVKFATRQGRRRGLGKVGKGNVYGLLVHAMVAVDAQNSACLGLVGGKVWTRSGRAKKHHQERRLSQKESRRWLDTPIAAKPKLAAASMVTVLDDREGDIYGKWAAVPSEGMHLLTRASQNRRLAANESLFTIARTFPQGDRRWIELAARPGQAARDAEVVVRFGSVVLCRPKNTRDRDLPPNVELRLVEVYEPNPPRGAERVHWRLLTTHAVADEAAAWQIVDWYLMRWVIEQLHRTMKRQGFQLEDSQIESADRLLKLAAITTKAAALTIQLVQARDGTTKEPAKIALSEDEIDTLDVLSSRVEGKTALQKNPHPRHSLAWATWIIARLGGWNGYASSKPPGPITIGRGLERFFAISMGHHLENV